MKRFSIFLCIVALYLGMGLTAHAATIDLSSWTQYGDASAGNWTVSSDGSSVYQSINGYPTYFVSDTEYINMEFEGNFKVKTTSDDDYIGFVFGFNGLDDYLLFDWKQLDQNFSWGQAYEGFTLSRISGSGVDEWELWDHAGDGIEVLASDYGSDKGWADETTYNFTLTYQENRIIIEIDGIEIFDISGSFDAGSFGFYNFSQASVEYQGFEEDPAPVPEPATMLLLGSGLVGIAGLRRKFRKVS